MQSDIFIKIEYPFNPKPRWTETAPHSGLGTLFNSCRKRVHSNLKSFNRFAADLSYISGEESDQGDEPFWHNEWLPGLDAVALYSFVRLRKPMTYWEIGSGISTRFVGRAIRDGQLNTRIRSIDPSPRSEVDGLCHEIIRTRLEDFPVDSLLSQLKSGDIVFFDGTHTCFQNSDVTAFFLDIFPKIPKNVLVGIHDIFLPYDYPEKFLDRNYSEQYVLGSWLIADNQRLYRIELPAFYASMTGVANQSLAPMWKALPDGVISGGGAFWMTKIR